MTMKWIHAKPGMCLKLAQLRRDWEGAKWDSEKLEAWQEAMHANFPESRDFNRVWGILDALTENTEYRPETVALVLKLIVDEDLPEDEEPEDGAED